jgi:hypothetical protein
MGETWARCDFVIDVKGGILVLEVDEFQHELANYSISCELRRMTQIVEAFMLGGLALPVFFIRFNPDAFTVDGQNKRVPIVTRLNRLVTHIRELDLTNAPGLQVLYMYYDIVKSPSSGAEYTLKQWESPEYDDKFKALCLSPIV